MKITQIHRRYECPDCKGQFSSYALSTDEPPPSKCPLCGSNMSVQKKRRHVRKVSEDAQQINPMRSGGNRNASKSADSVYRSMENASEERAGYAAELLGVDKSTMSGMKMTNMADNLREGDSSMPSEATKLTGSVSGGIDYGNGVKMNMNFQNNQAASEFAKSTGVGPEPYAGNRQREVITSRHAQLARSVEMSGRLNKR